MTCPRRFSSRFPVSRLLSRMAVLVALMAVLLAPSVVHAQDYPPQPTVLTDQPIVTEGGIVTLTGSGFLPNSLIEVYLASGPTGSSERTLLGTTMSDSEGNFTFQWDTAGYPPGTYTLIATDGINSATTEIIVTAAGEQAVVAPVRTVAGAPPAAVGRTLPVTGGIGGVALRLGIVLLTIGGLAMVASRGQWRKMLPTR